MSRSLLVFSILCFFGIFNLNAAPPILSYAGQVSVNGQPFTGTGQFKFAFVDGQGQFSYWSHDGSSAAGSEPTGSVSLSVSAGLYSVMLGDTALSGMSAIDEAVFQNHNDVHLRIWFSDGINGFEQLSPDRRFASVPYVLGNDGTGSANLADASGSGGGGGERFHPAGDRGGGLRAPGCGRPERPLLHPCPARRRHCGGACLRRGRDRAIGIFLRGAWLRSAQELRFLSPDPDRSGFGPPDRHHRVQVLRQFAGPPGQRAGSPRSRRRGDFRKSTPSDRLHPQGTDRGARGQDHPLRVRLRG
ncbi:MAG: hypothetical protein ACJZ7A_03775 [Opitutales bacterium]